MLLTLVAVLVVPVVILAVRPETDAANTVDASQEIEHEPRTEPEPGQAARRDATRELQGRTYTPKSLKAMIAGGKYPQQDEPTTESKEMPFAACIERMGEVADAIGSNYPRQVLVKTAILRMQKLWTNDAAVTITCSAPDQKLVITSAKYL